MRIDANPAKFASQSNKKTFRDVYLFSVYIEESATAARMILAHFPNHHNSGLFWSQSFVIKKCLCIALKETCVTRRCRRIKLE